LETQEQQGEMMISEANNISKADKLHCRFQYHLSKSLQVMESRDGSHVQITYNENNCIR